jgi:hypothetical protein
LFQSLKPAFFSNTRRDICTENHATQQLKANYKNPSYYIYVTQLRKNPRHELTPARLVALQKRRNSERLQELQPQSPAAFSIPTKTNKQPNKQSKERNQRSESQNRGTLDCSSKREKRENGMNSSMKQS